MTRQLLLRIVATLICIAVPSNSPINADPKSPKSVRTLRRGANCLVKKPRRVAASDARGYQLLWTSTFGTAWNGEPSMPPPKVDFQAEMVLGAFLGEQSTGGYAVEIQDAVEENGKLVVTVKEIAPGPDSFVTQAITTPFHVVAVKRSALPVQWKVVSGSR